MLLPQYSLRASLILVSSCALFFLVLGQAYRQQPWAIVIAVGVISLAVILVFHAITYLVAMALSLLVSAEQTPARTSRGGLQSTPDEQSPPSPGGAP